MKFDPDRPHGTTYGDPLVAHEQDGVMFGFDNLPVIREDAPKMQEVAEIMQPDADKSAKMRAIWAARKAKALQAVDASR